MKAHEFDRVVSKFDMNTRHGRDLLVFFVHEGKVITRTRRSKSSGDVPMQHSIRQQLKLNEDQLSEAISCGLTREGYVDILRDKGLL